jgi:hypothetical protein
MYDDLPAGFQVFDDIPDGFSLDEPGWLGSNRAQGNAKSLEEFKAMHPREPNMLERAGIAAGDWLGETFLGKAATAAGDVIGEQQGVVEQSRKATGFPDTNPFSYVSALDMANFLGPKLPRMGARAPIETPPVEAPAKPTVAQELGLDEATDTVRMYHGGDDRPGARWFTTDLDYAKGYADKTSGSVFYVDLPADSPYVTSEIPGHGVKEGFTFAHELPAEISNTRKPFKEPTLEPQRARNETDLFTFLRREFPGGLRNDRGDLDAITAPGIVNKKGGGVALDDQLLHDRLIEEGYLNPYGPDELRDAGRVRDLLDERWQAGPKPKGVQSQSYSDKIRQDQIDVAAASLSERMARELDDENFMLKPQEYERALALSDEGLDAESIVMRLGDDEFDRVFGGGGETPGLNAMRQKPGGPIQLGEVEPPLPREYAGAAAKLPKGTTEPIFTEAIGRDINNTILDLMKAGNVKMTPGVKVSDQVYELLQTDYVPKETINAILQKHGQSIDSFAEGFYRKQLAEGVRESARKGAQTIQQYSDMGKLLKDKFEPEEYGGLFNNTKKLRGIYSGLIVSQLGTTMRDALGSMGAIGVDTLARGIEAVLRPGANAIRKASGLPEWLEPIDVFGNWRALGRRNKERVAKVVSAFPQERDALFNAYASDVIKSTGGGLLGKIQKAVDLANFHKVGQESIFRRAFFAAELERRLAARGKNLDDMIANNEMGSISREDLSAAVNEALRLTFGKNLKPFGENALDSFGRGFDAVQSLGGINPFPPFPFTRFMTQAIRYQFDHSPFGAVKMFSRKERNAIRKGGGGSLAIVSRALAGSALFYAAYGIREKMGGGQWYEVKVPGGPMIDARSLFPIAPYLFAADLMKRYQDNTLLGMDWQELVKGIAGANLRGGVGFDLVDSLLTDVAGVDTEGKMMRGVKKWIGDVAGGLSMPMQNLKDFWGAFDPNENIVRDTSKSPLVGPAQARIPGLSQMLPEVESPTQAGPIVREGPLLRQLTGIPLASKNSVAGDELNRLGFKRNEVLPYSGVPEYDTALARRLGPVVEAKLGRVVQHPKYQAMTNAEKSLIMREALIEAREEASALAKKDNVLAALRKRYLQVPRRERAVREERGFIPPQ